MSKQPDRPNPGIYPSRALNPERREIRVLRLEPGEYGSEISCSLEIASLDQYKWHYYPLDDYRLRRLPNFYRSVFLATGEDCIEAVKQHNLPRRTCRSRCRTGRGAKYESSLASDSSFLQIPTGGTDRCQCFEAMSYTWGPSNGGRSISLCGEAGFKVTDNLFRALQRLKYAELSRVLLIDAIFINQRDFDERAQQVRIMADIYRTCWNLVIWLGGTDMCAPETPGGFMYELGEIPNFWDDLSEETIDSLMKARGEPVQIYQSALLDIKASTTPLWWQRMWVVPEMIAFGFDPGPEVAIGPIRLPWWAFLTAVQPIDSTASNELWSIV